MELWRKLIKPEFYDKCKLTRCNAVKFPAGYMFKHIIHHKDYEVFYTRVEQDTER